MTYMLYQLISKDPSGYHSFYIVPHVLLRNSCWKDGVLILMQRTWWMQARVPWLYNTKYSKEAQVVSDADNI